MNLKPDPQLSLEELRELSDRIDILLKEAPAGAKPLGKTLPEHLIEIFLALRQATYQLGHDRGRRDAQADAPRAAVIILERVGEIIDAEITRLRREI